LRKSAPRGCDPNGADRSQELFFLKSAEDRGRMVFLRMGKLHVADAMPNLASD
jgi:hypothetical protein